MNKTDITKYEKTGEFRATMDFNREEVDWNMIHNHVRSGCHCVWVESDLESYVNIYGYEENCVQSVVDCLNNSLKLTN